MIGVCKERRRSQNEAIKGISFFFGDVWKAAEWAVVFVLDEKIAAGDAAAINYFTLLMAFRIIPYTASAMR